MKNVIKIVGAIVVLMFINGCTLEENVLVRAWMNQQPDEAAEAIQDLTPEQKAPGVPVLDAAQFASLVEHVRNLEAQAAAWSVWDDLAQCESGGDWSINTGNGYYGGLQFLLSTWHAVGGTGYPHENSREEQIYRAEILLAQSGWGQWPACSSMLGLR